MGLRVQILLMARMFFSFMSVLYSVGSELIPPSEQSYWLCVSVLYGV